jgi:hypothetical protein
MKKYFLGGTAILAITAVAAINVSLGAKNNDFSVVSLANIEALADENNASNCPGGYCSSTDSFGDKCSACCPGGKNPKCSFGSCECNPC